jgi:hypothetical protein
MTYPMSSASKFYLLAYPLRGFRNQSLHQPFLADTACLSWFAAKSVNLKMAFSGHLKPDTEATQ